MKKGWDKLSWITRIKLCWTVLTTGKYNPKEYKTKHEDEQWQICQKRLKEMQATIRPRSEFTCTDPNDIEQ